MFSIQSILDRFSTSADNEAWDACMEIANTNEVVFIKGPIYERKLFAKRYVNSNILFDSTDEFYGNKRSRKTENKRLSNFPEKIDSVSNNTQRPEREDIEIKTKKPQPSGFCIRIGKKIKFNPKQPMSKVAWKIWNEYGNEDFKEKYCHKTGEKSNGKTSMKNPVL